MPLSEDPRIRKVDASGKPIEGYVDPSVFMETGIRSAARANPALAGGLAAAGKVAEKAAGTPAGKVALSGLEYLSNIIDQIEGAGAGYLAYQKKHFARDASLKESIEAAKKGAERRASYQETFGPSGVALDLFGPVTAMLPLDDVAKLTKMIGGPAVGAAGRAIEKAAPDFAAGAKSVRTAFDKPYAYKKAGIPEGIDIESEYAGKMHQIAHMKPTEAELKAKELVPSAEGQKNVAIALEHPDMVEALAKNEREAFDLLKPVRDSLKEERIAGGVLDAEAAANLEQRIGAEYFPHIKKAPADQIKAIDAAIESAKASGKDTAFLESLRKEAEYAGRSNTQKLYDKIRGRVRQPSFAKRRAGTTFRDMGDVINVFNTNAADALGVARVQTAQAIATKSYLMDYIDMLKKKPGMIVDEATPGYAKIPPMFPGMPDNVYVPEAVHKKIMGITQRLANPEEGMLTALPVLDWMNREFRNWNLFTRPSTLLMNAVGNIHNNYVRLLMGPESIKDYVNAGKFLVRKKLGRLSSSVESPVRGISETELDDMLIRHRKVGTGWSHEPGYVHAKDKRTKMQKVRGLAGTESPLLIPGQKLFSLIEDHSRVAAFINQMNKGQMPREASKNVFDSLFDYELGLTDFERNVMRRFIPFYSWTRFNLPLQYRMLLEHPKQYMNMVRAARAAQDLVGGPTPDESTWAPYMRESVPFRYGYDPQTGEYRVFLLGNMVPSAQAFSEPKELGKEFVTGLTPAISVPGQLLSNTDWLRSTPDNHVPIKKYPGEVENVLGVNLPKKAAWLAKQFPPVRIANQVRQQLQQGKGAAGVARRLGIGYTPTVDPKVSEEIYVNRVKGQLRELNSKRTAALIASKDPKKTADERKAAEANVKILTDEIDRILREFKAHAESKKVNQP